MAHREKPFSEHAQFVKNKIDEPAIESLTNELFHDDTLEKKASSGVRAGKMSKKYMNRVFMETFNESFERPPDAQLQKNFAAEYWSIDERARP